MVKDPYIGTRLINLGNLGTKEQTFYPQYIYKVPRLSTNLLYYVQCTDHGMNRRPSSRISLTTTSQKLMSSLHFGK